ncbi:MAG TPA: alpha/beta hydrolase [Roseiflexaceae bacterium]|nr:alpha/beta hydrolase [Roseiflexaceae bacterium]
MNTYAEIGQPIPLWPEQAPGALATDPDPMPTITPYLAARDVATGAAMVILPGGGYGALAAHEGHDYAVWLNAHGISCFVTRYRLGSAGYRHPTMLTDAARALRFVRAHAAQWRLDPKRIGMMGSSAGGHLAATLLTHFDHGQPDADDHIERQSSRPALGILCYPVISMTEWGHAGSRTNLLGENPTPELLHDLSNDQQVTPETPACFVWHTWEDASVPVENSLLFAAALRRHGVPFDLHVYQQGRHGIGLADTAPFANPHPWTHDLLFWLRIHNFVAPIT